MLVREDIQSLFFFGSRMFDVRLLLLSRSGNTGPK